MKNVNHLLPALILTFALNGVANIMAQTTSVSVPPRLNLMPVPASVQLDTGRLPITGSFTVSTKGHADDRLRAGILRMTQRLAGRTVLSLPLELGTDENAATLVVQCSGPGATIPSLGEDESYSLDISDKQARLVAPTVVGALRGISDQPAADFSQ